MTPAITLSQGQVSFLVSAAREDTGIPTLFGVQPTTLAILSAAGFIAKTRRLLASDRAACDMEIHNHVLEACRALGDDDVPDAPDWHRALELLHAAREVERRRDAVVRRITKAGRAAVVAWLEAQRTRRGGPPPWVRAEWVATVGLGPVAEDYIAITKEEATAL